MQGFRQLRTLGALATVFAVHQAHAIPVTYEFSGTCVLACGNIALSSGAAITGGFVTDDTSLSDGYVQGSEIGNFWMDFGTFTLNNSNSSIASTLLQLNGSESSFISGLFRIDGGTPGSIAYDFLSLEGINTWTFVLPDRLAPTGVGSFSRATSVPEPGTLSLLGAGLLAVGFLGRRKRQRV